MILCEFCDEWFHYSCVGMTNAKAKQYGDDKAWFCSLCDGENVNQSVVILHVPVIQWGGGLYITSACLHASSLFFDCSVKWIY